MDPATHFSFCKPMVTFLNGLEDHMPMLLDTIALNVYTQPTILDDFQVVLLYGNSPILLDKYFYKVYDIRNVRSSTLEIAGEELPYHFSDRHMEMPLTDLYIQHLKGITKNNTLSKRKYLFYLKCHGRLTPLLYNQLKNIVETSLNAVFVLATSSRSDVSSVLTNMACQINVSFPCERLYRFYKDRLDMFQHEKPMSYEDMQGYYQQLPNDNIGCILRMVMNRKTKLEDAIDKFLETCEREKNDLTLIMESRELAYKMFHLNYPIALIAKYLLSVLPSHVHQDFAILAAQSDHMCAISKKDVMTYERFLIKTIHVLRTTPPKKKIARKVIIKKSS